MAYTTNVSRERTVLDTGEGDDVVRIMADAPTKQVRVTFTSSEVGNGDPNDSNTMENQDGGLAVRIQAEDENGVRTGRVSRFDDEGITFIALDGIRFDVRDLVSGLERGDTFGAVVLGTAAADTIDETDGERDYYINGGMGDDNITGGNRDDFLVGGAGDDRLVGLDGEDQFIGGGGDDVIYGGRDIDTVFYDISTDGADQVNLTAGEDRVFVSNSSIATNEIRLTFTSSEVGNGEARDSDTMDNQDGGFAVQMQAENAVGDLVGPVSRYDDEGIRFISTDPEVTFDVRDLVSGTARGAEFQSVILGTRLQDIVNEMSESDNYYINGGRGNDRITAGSGDDFLVGGAGNDFLVGRNGADTFIGGGGDDVVYGGNGRDVAIYNLSTDGSDKGNLGSGLDTLNVNLDTLTTEGQIRLTFTSSEVGNADVRDSNSMSGQDGGFAVRIQGENALGELEGSEGRFDDEGIIFDSATEGVTFDVRDLVSGTERGDQFDVVILGTLGDDGFNQTRDTESYYINGGMGDDRLFGGRGEDFLVGGAGDDVLSGKRGDDSLLGGAGEDIFFFNGRPGNDEILDFVSGTDRIDLSAYGITEDNVETVSSGDDTIVRVDGDQDGDSDFQFTLVDSGPPATSDFIFG
jgi:Ca2+-binding RTX toxin-like protein